MIHIINTALLSRRLRERSGTSAQTPSVPPLIAPATQQAPAIPEETTTPPPPAPGAARPGRAVPYRPGRAVSARPTALPPAAQRRLSGRPTGAQLRGTGGEKGAPPPSFPPSPAGGRPGTTHAPKRRAAPRPAEGRCCPFRRPGPARHSHDSPRNHPGDHRGGSASPQPTGPEWPRPRPRPPHWLGG